MHHQWLCILKLVSKMRRYTPSIPSYLTIINSKQLLFLAFGELLFRLDLIRLIPPCESSSSTLINLCTT